MCKSKVFPWWAFYFISLMVVVGRPDYRIDCRSIKGGSQVSSLIVSFLESSNHCILASPFLVLVCFSLWVLELLVILLTSSSSSKTEFTCIFYDVFDVGGYAGSSLLEVSLLFLLGIPPLPSLFWGYSLACIQQAWACSIRSSFVEVMAVLVFFVSLYCLLCKMKDS